MSNYFDIEFISDKNKPFKLSKSEEKAFSYFDDIAYLQKNMRVKGEKYGESLRDQDIFSFMAVGKKFKPSYLWNRVNGKYKDYQLVEPIFKTKDARKVYDYYFDKLIILPLLTGGQSYLLTYKNNAKNIVKKLKKIKNTKTFHLILGEVLGFGDFSCDFSNKKQQNKYVYSIGFLYKDVYHTIMTFNLCTTKKNEEKKINMADKKVIEISKNIYDKFSKHLEKIDIMLMATRTNYEKSPRFKILYP